VGGRAQPPRRIRNGSIELYPRSRRQKLDESKGSNMDVSPLLHAPAAIRIHLLTVLPALAIGTWQIFFSVKGSRLHRGFGFAYLALMTITAGAAFLIRSAGNGHLTPIHLFIPLTLFGVIGALWYARRGDIAGHRRAMLGLYFGGLIFAGALAFLPGRLMHRVFFD
jgi:uncharacterized membrane protein